MAAVFRCLAQKLENGLVSQTHRWGSSRGRAVPEAREWFRADARRLAGVTAGLLLWLAAWVVAPPGAEAAQSSATYRMTFEGTWTTAVTPGGLPGSAHFTILIGAVHSDGVTFWQRGGMASPGVELVAELGQTGTFKREIEAGEHVFAVIDKIPGDVTGEVTEDIEVTSDHPLVTLLSMIAPSPDWFIGVSGLSLLNSEGRWLRRLEVDLFPYDAGTEEGTGFSLSNPATVPQETITSIRGIGQFTDLPIAKLIFERQDLTLNVPLFPSASDPQGRQGFVRVINHSDEAGEVGIVATDDTGMSSDPLTLAMAAGETVHFNSDDLEMGNAGKGLSGSALPGEGDWRLGLTSSLDIEVLSYIRTQDKFLTAMHGIVPSEGNSHRYRVAIFNPASNTAQVSSLRLINSGEEDALVTITGVDDQGASPGTDVRLRVPAGMAERISAQDLEGGVGVLQGQLGDGMGKWSLVVESDQPLTVMNLLESPTGHLSNLSTTPGGGAALSAAEGG